MYEFLQYVLEELRNSLALVLLAGLLAVGALALSWFVHRARFRGQRKYPWGKALGILALVGYLAVVTYATILRGVGGYRQWNLHLFRAWREAWNTFSAKTWANVLLNVAMFWPLGFLLPLLWKPCRRWYAALGAGFGLSLAIELIQLTTGRGICDVDDLFANALGAAMGYLLSMAILCFGKKRVKRGLGYGGLFLASLGCIGGIFLAYGLKEYGNLPMAPAYTNDTSSTQWRLDCHLPQGQEAAVYATQTRSLAQCDAFAEEFRQIVRAEYDSILYYEEAAYYLDQTGDENGAHFLFLNYLDPGYEYQLVMREDVVWATADRQTIADALGKFPCQIPENAEFDAQGEGWHSFSIDRFVDGALMLDGTLRCRYAADGTIHRIENNLLAYTYHDTVAIINGQEAYQRLMDGKFNDGGYFAWKAPASVTVTGCQLGYAVDTKGFYQPVYFFVLESPDGSYQDEILIPAMG